MDVIDQLPASFDFAVKLPKVFAEEQALFSADVLVEGILLCRLNMVIEVEGKKENIHIERKDIRSAFISYSSMDRGQVASIVYGMKKARPDMDVFFDVERLDSGSRWEDILKKEILSRDLLYLCWSENAKASEWVDREWRCAYSAKGIDGVEPIPLEAPEQCPPPAELNALHFNDIFLMLMRMDSQKYKSHCGRVLNLMDGNSISLQKGMIGVGRDQDNDIVIDRDRTVGNRQCWIAFNMEKNTYVIHDYGRNSIGIYDDNGFHQIGTGMTYEANHGSVVKIGKETFLLLD